MTTAVGHYQANAFGLYDMHGNVWEWVQDWAGDYPSGAVTDPQGASQAEYRVLRGGSFLLNQGDVRCAFRDWDGPQNRGGHPGFRVVLLP